MIDVEVLKEYLTSPFILLFFAGIFLLLVPVFFRKKEGVPYAFTKFFRVLNPWGTKDRLLVMGSVITLLGLFGFLFVDISQKFNPSVFFPAPIIKEEESPVTLILVDVSGSMKQKISLANVKFSLRPELYQLARQAFVMVVETTHPSWKIGLVVFSNGIYYARVPVGFDDRSVLLDDALAEELSNKNSFGEISSGTKLFEAVVFAVDVLERDFPDAKERSILIISDMIYSTGKLVSTFVETELAGIGLHLIVVNTANRTSESLFQAYFGERGHSINISKVDDIGKVLDFSDLVFSSYSLPGGEDEEEGGLDAEHASGLDMNSRLVLFSVGGLLALHLALRGTVARRIP